MGAVALLLLSVAAPAAWAHASPGTESELAQLWTRWTAEPWVVLLLVFSALFYARGVWRLWHHAGPGRGISRGQVACFASGSLALVLALVSPLDALGARLFSAHMVQHELLMLVAAPLLVLGRPLAAWSWGLPASMTRGVGAVFRKRAWSMPWSLITDPLAAWSLHALALWSWHVPSLFELALAHEGWHALQHASFLGTALLFWWAVLGGDARLRHGIGAAMLYLFTTMLHTGALGALLTLAPTPWYPTYAAHTAALGWDPVEDQQLGGLVMWVPGGLAYLVAGLALLGRLLTASRSPALRPAPAPNATVPAPPRSAAP